MSAAQPTALMSGRYQRAFTIAVVFLVAGWHLAGAGGQLLHNRTAYGSFAFQAAMWLIMALAVIAGSVLVLQDVPGWRPAWAVAVIALAASTAAAAASPDGHMLAVNWAWGSAGWIGVLVLFRRRFTELAWFLAAEAAAILAVQVGDGLHRTDLAGFLALLAWSTGAQVAVAAGVRPCGSPPARPPRRRRVNMPRASELLPRRSSRQPGTPAGWRCRKAPSRWWPSWRRGRLTRATRRCASGARSRRPGCAGCWPRETRYRDRWCTSFTRVRMWPSDAELPSRSRRPGRCPRCPARPGG
jgi:hypothetical protein